MIKIKEREQAKTNGQAAQRLAALAIELVKIERAIKEQQVWMHPQPCACWQCSAVFAELFKLSVRRQEMLSEITDGARFQFDCASDDALQ